MPPTAAAPRSRTPLQAWGASDPGRVRTGNEDCYRIDCLQGLCVVADGMGGHAAGDVAARIAADTVVEGMRAPSRPGPFETGRGVSATGARLRDAVHRANARVLQAAEDAAALAGMGTTVVAAVAAGGLLSVAHAGDSRLYLLTDRRLRQVTVDDSWLTGGVLTSVVGARRELDVHLFEQQLAGGELLLLTTDGVHGVLDPARIERMCARRAGERVSALADDLVSAALARGSRDNCTAVVAVYRP